MEMDAHRPGLSLVPAAGDVERGLVLQTEGRTSGQFDVGLLRDQVGYSIGIASDAEILRGQGS